MAIYNREDSRTVLPQLEKKLDGLIDLFYPVGCFFETTDGSFNPNKAWGGRWELEEEGQFHISAGDNYDVGDSGGYKDATLPSHTHTVNGGSIAIGSSGGHGHTIRTKYYPNYLQSGSNRDAVNGIGGSTSDYISSTVTDGSHTHTVPNHTHTVSTDGADGTGKNLPPFIVVNRWHRVA